MACLPGDTGAAAVLDAGAGAGSAAFLVGTGAGVLGGEACVRAVVLSWVGFGVATAGLPGIASFGLFIRKNAAAPPARTTAKPSGATHFIDDGFRTMTGIGGGTGSAGGASAEAAAGLASIAVGASSFVSTGNDSVGVAGAGFG